MDVSSLSATFAHVPTDWIILFAVALLITLDALRSGASRAIALSLALPITYAVPVVLPKAAFLGTIIKPMSTGVPGAVIILIVLAVTTTLTYRISRDYNSASASQAIMAGVAATSLLAVFWLQIPALSALWHFSAPATTIFGAMYSLYILVGGYAVLAAVRS